MTHQETQSYVDVQKGRSKLHIGEKMTHQETQSYVQFGTSLLHIRQPRRRNLGCPLRTLFIAYPPNKATRTDISPSFALFGPRTHVLSRWALKRALNQFRAKFRETDASCFRRIR